MAKSKTPPNWKDNQPVNGQPVIWQNRIIRYGDAIVDDLLANPFNARIHGQAQQAHLSGLLKEIGIVDTICINERTGHLVDGHLRMVLADRFGVLTLPARWVDLSENEEKLILASFDWITGLATYDWDALDSLLKEVQTDSAALQSMLNEQAQSFGLYDSFNPMDEWTGMPEFEHHDIAAPYSIKVNFFSPDDIREFAVLVGQPVTEKTRYINFPFVPKTDLTQYTVTTDES